ncbi:MAG: ABC transporter ATP-binding protein [Acetobacteraceae bacterium]|jgi:peptide/nickel transport system ATP-binding protein
MRPARAPLLEMTDVSIVYHTRAGPMPAVTGVSLTIDEGEAVALVGESGCGKSTLALASLGHFGRTGRITGGSIRFAGENIATMSGKALQRLRGPGIGMVYQEAMSVLNPSLRVGSQLIETAIIHRRLAHREARIAAQDMLAEMQIPDPERIMAAYPHQLSGGQQQRAVIAMALLPQPRLLLLDEPTTALDVTVEAGIVDLLGVLRRTRRTAMLFISHNLGLVARICDRAAVMYAGEIVETGDVHRIFARPRHPYTAGLLRCIPRSDLPRGMQKLVPIPGQMQSHQESQTGCRFGPRCTHFRREPCAQAPIPLKPVGPGGLASARCARSEEIAWQPTEEGAEPSIQYHDETLLAVNALDKFYPMRVRSQLRTLRANHDLTFNIARGQSIAIVGESGCGKSTFARIVMGLTAASGGRAMFETIDLARLPVERRPATLLRALQMVFQNPDETLNPCYAVGTQIARAVRKLGVARGRAAVRERVGELLSMTRLPAAYAGRRPRQLSGGQKQRVGIARAFAGTPTLVVADEPVSALDVSVQAAIIALLADIQRTQQTTFIIISHDLGFVRYIADSVVVMYLGQIVEAGTVEQVFEPPWHPYTEALLAAAPTIDPSKPERRIVLTGELPNAVSPPTGCPFHTRCQHKVGPICETTAPPERLAQVGHRIRCHIPISDLAKRTSPSPSGGAGGGKIDVTTQSVGASPEGRSSPAPTGQNATG